MLKIIMCNLLILSQICEPLLLQNNKYEPTVISEDKYVHSSEYVQDEYYEEKNLLSKNEDTIIITMKSAQYVLKRVTSTSINLDTWRLYSGYLFDSNQGMHLMWENSDAEGAIKVQGEDDFVCGYHGDEIMEMCKIIVDGEEIDLNRQHIDKEFSEANIYVKSNVYHCNTSKDANTLLFERNKQLKFYGDTVEVLNYFSVKDAVTIESAKICMFQCFKTNNEGKQMLNTYSVNTENVVYDVFLTKKSQKPKASNKIYKAEINTIYGNIDFESLGSSAQNYLGYVVDFSEQNRIKWYFDTIASSTDVDVDEVLFSKFKWTISK